MNENTLGIKYVLGTLNAGQYKKIRRVGNIDGIENAIDFPKRKFPGFLVFRSLIEKTYILTYQ